jgi:hypothetical protein
VVNKNLDHTSKPKPPASRIWDNLPESKLELIDGRLLAGIRRARNLFTLDKTVIMQRIANLGLSEELFSCSQFVAKPTDSGKRQWTWWISRSHQEAKKDACGRQWKATSRT